MQVDGLHNPCPYVFLGADGHTRLFDFRNCEHLSAHLESIDEVRPSKAWYLIAAEHGASRSIQGFVDEIVDLVRAHGKGQHSLAYVRLDAEGFIALQAHGVAAASDLELMDFARMIKSSEEIACMQDAIAACEMGLHRMQAAHVPTTSEQALWAVLIHANAEIGGEWMETRLLSAGQRTNAWHNECGEYVIQAGDLVSFDTDLVGRHSYSVDISRAWLTSDGATSDVQRQIYALAHGKVHHDAAELLPGRLFSDVARSAYQLPPRFVPRMNRAIAHDFGLCNEYPLIVDREFAAEAYDGQLMGGMVLCVESYVGAPGGTIGVKLEEQVVVKSQGAQAIFGFPFEARLM